MYIKKTRIREDTHKIFLLVVGPLRGGRGEGVVKPTEPLRKKTFFLWFKKHLPEPPETQKKNNKKKMHVMFSAGKYRSTEKRLWKNFAKYLKIFYSQI